MQPGGHHGSNGTNAPPCRPPAEQMTPEQKEDVFMAAGYLAAEYLVSVGKMPPHVMWNRPPPRLFQERPHAPQHGQLQPRKFQERPHAPQHGPFQQGGRPLAKPQFRSQQGPSRWFGPRAFQDRSIAKRPRQQAPRPFQRCPPPQRPFASGGRGGAAPPKTGWCISHGAAQAGTVMQGAVQEEPASGDGSNRQQPAPQSGDAGAAESPTTADQPSQR